MFFLLSSYLPGYSSVDSLGLFLRLFCEGLALPSSSLSGAPCSSYVNIGASSESTALATSLPKRGPELTPTPLSWILDLTSELPTGYFHVAVHRRPKPSVPKLGHLPFCPQMATPPNSEWHHFQPVMLGISLDSLIPYRQPHPTQVQAPGASPWPPAEPRAVVLMWKPPSASDMETG